MYSHILYLQYLLEIFRGFFLFKMFKPTLSQNTVNLAGNETTRNNFNFHPSWKFISYFSQAYSDGKETDLWDFEHSITLCESDHQAATVLTETTSPFL